ncbi:MAG: aldo/keto reductase [Phycisphaeraceae bacterium]
MINAPVQGPVSEQEFFAERVRIPHLPPCRRLGVGTAHLGQMLDTDRQSQGVRVLHEAWGAGFLLTDSAPIYGQPHGERTMRHRAEQMVGQALGSWQGPPPILCTKLDVVAPGSGESWRDTLAAQHRQSRTLYDSHPVQGLALHDPHRAREQADTFVQTAMDYLHEQHDRRTVAAIGVGGGGPAVQQQCLSRGAVSYVLTYMRLSALSLQGLADIVPAARAHGAALILGSPLLMGLLGDRFEAWTAKPPRFLPPVLIERARQFHRLAKQVALSMSQLALRFALSLPMAEMVLTGLSSPEALADTRQAFEQGPLPPDLYADIWRLAQSGGAEPRLGG